MDTGAADKRQKVGSGDKRLPLAAGNSASFSEDNDPLQSLKSDDTIIANADDTIWKTATLAMANKIRNLTTTDALPGKCF